MHLAQLKADKIIKKGAIKKGANRGTRLSIKKGPILIKVNSVSFMFFIKYGLLI